MRGWCQSRVPRKRSSRRTCCGSSEQPSLATESNESKGVRDWADPRLACANIVSRREVDILDSASEWARLEQKLHIGGPAAARHRRLVAERLDQLAQNRDAIEAKGREGIGGVGFQESRALHPVCKAVQPAHRCRRLGHLLACGHYIRAPLESLHQLRDVFRLIGEIRLHHYQSIAPSVAGAARDLANELVESGAVSLPPFSAQNCERDYFSIWAQRLVRPIRAGIIVNDDLVLTRVVLKNPANAPQEHTDGLALVVGRNTDIEQFNSGAMGWLRAGVH